MKSTRIPRPSGKSRVAVLVIAVICLATLQAARAQTNGLVAAYSFDEGTGTIVNDTSGNGNAGTISGATWTTSGKFGNALVFNGSNSLIKVNDSASLDLTSGMTLEAWVYPATTVSGWRDIVYKANDTYYLEAGSSSGGAPAGGGTFTNGNQNIYGVSPLTVNTWTHLALTFDGSNLRLWVNGVQVSTQAQTSPLTTSTQQLMIGGDSIYGQYFNGRIDEVRIYNRALSQTELQTDMVTPIGNVSDTTPPTAPANLNAFAGGAAPSVIARQSYLNTTLKTTHTTASFNSTGGDLIVVLGSSHENVATMTVTDNKGNTYISAAGPANHSSASVDLRTQLWYAKSPVTGSSHTVTLTLSTKNSAVISVLVIKGSQTAAPIDTVSAITDNGADDQHRERNRRHDPAGGFVDRFSQNQHRGDLDGRSQVHV